jgi:tetratricopeptide (TPR) repeat protein
MTYMTAHHQTSNALTSLTSRGDHTLNVRMLWFRGRVEREEPAMLALDLLSQDRADDALDVATSALAGSPRDPELLLACGRAHLMRGEIDAAREACIEAAREGKDWAEAFAWLARVLVREGRGTKAAEVAERAVLLGARDADLALIEGPRRGMRLLNERTKRYLKNPNSDEPALLSLALEEAGKKADALTVIEQGLTLDAGDPDLVSIQRRLTGELEELAATCIDVPAIEPELDEDEKEAAFFASLGIREKKLEKHMHEPSVIVSDTLVGEPAPKLHARTAPFPLTTPKRSGWLPNVAAAKTARAEAKAKDERLPGMPPATVRTAPIARVARRDPTVRFWLGM